MKTLSLLLSLVFTHHLSAKVLSLNPLETRDTVIKLFDCDKDLKITIEDQKCRVLKWELQGIKLSGAYELASLLEIVSRAENRTRLEFNAAELKLHPVDRISSNIRNFYWDGLTRMIDGPHLGQVMPDQKIGGGKAYLYVPHGEKEQLNYFKKFQTQNLIVESLPQRINDDWVKNLGEKHGLLSLGLKDGKGVPYVVPGGRFNEMYGWDSYFHILGVLQDKRPELALGMVENFIFQIEHYGKILNANRTYYLTRSQPPFLTSAIQAVLPYTKADKKWLERALRAAFKEYFEVWMGPDRLTSIGLSRYAGFAKGIPPEVEPGHFNETLKPYSEKYGISMTELMNRFNQGKLQEPKLDEFFRHDRAVRESGHDTTYRWRVNGEDRCSDFVTVDLNSLLLKYELDLAELMERHFQGKFDRYTAVDFKTRAQKRLELMRQYLWDPEKSLFFDYNFVDKKRSGYASATTFYPLWASDKILSKKESAALVKAALKQLEFPGGLAASAEASLKAQGKDLPARQWDYPNGWAPHQILAWQGLKKYGYEQAADRLMYKWLKMISTNARDYNGTIPEKYDVVNRSHKVFAEYGNVGTDFSYITQEGFGWMNASYQLGLNWISEKMRQKLRNELK